MRSVALQNAQSILLARRRADEELVQAKKSLEHRTGELAHSLAMMRATFESTSDAILVTDGSGKVTDFNATVRGDVAPARGGDGTARTTGTSSASSAAHSPRPSNSCERVETIYASQPPETHDVLETLDGRTIERSTRMQIVDGRNIGRVWNFREVTERKRAEQALRDETRILEILHQTGKTIASELDLQTVVQAVTDAATQLSKAQFGAFFYNVTNQQGESFLLYTLSGAPREAFEKFGLPRNTPVFDPTFRGTAARTIGRHHEGTLLRPDVASPRHAERPPAGPQLLGGAGHLAFRRGHRRVVLRAPRDRRVHRAHRATGRGNRGTGRHRHRQRAPLRRRAAPGRRARVVVGIGAHRTRRDAARRAS